MAGNDGSGWSRIDETSGDDKRWEAGLDGMIGGLGKLLKEANGIQGAFGAALEEK